MSAPFAHPKTLWSRSGRFGASILTNGDGLWVVIGAGPGGADRVWGRVLAVAPDAGTAAELRDLADALDAAIAAQEAGP